MQYVKTKIIFRFVGINDEDAPSFVVFHQLSVNGEQTNDLFR